jgi:hypothetical protein
VEDPALSLGSGSDRAVARARLDLAQAELELLSARVARARAILVLDEGRERKAR